MIYFFTGKPGAGKTLSAINYVLEDSVFNVKDENGKDILRDDKPIKRPVYYFNIKEVTHPWTELSLEEVKKWYELPVGSVIFIDECQDVFTGVQRNNAVPPLYSKLNTNRHAGYDLILITQSGTLLPTIIRPLVDRHFHIENESGAQGCKWVERGAYIDNPDRKASRAKCEISIKKYPKHIYGTYKSAEIHTKKLRVPKVIYKTIFMTVVLAIMVIGASYKFGNDMFGSEPEVEKPKEATTPTRPQRNSSNIANKDDSNSFQPLLPLDLKGYLAATKPRVKGIPHTAPLYDSFALNPAQRPQTVCVGMHKTSGYICKCYTEQMTSLDTPHNTCVDIVNNGMYDVTLNSSNPSTP